MGTNSVSSCTTSEPPQNQMSVIDGVAYTARWDVHNGEESHPLGLATPTSNDVAARLQKSK